jgi:AcrR family transcriptional regulator
MPIARPSGGDGPVPGATRVGTRQLIYDAAVEQIHQCGFAGASVRKIARTAHVDPATIYHYYASKEALLSEIVKTTTQWMVACADRLMAVPTPEVRLACLAAFHVRVCCTRPRECVISDRDLNLLPDRDRESQVRLRDQYERCWEATLEAGASSGRFVVDDVRLTRLAAVGLCSQPQGWYSPGGRLPMESLMHHYAAFVLGMVAPTPLGDEHCDAAVNIVLRVPDELP